MSENRVPPLNLTVRERDLLVSALRFAQKIGEEQCDGKGVLSKAGAWAWWCVRDSSTDIDRLLAKIGKTS